MSAGPLVIPRRSFLRGLNLAAGGLALGYCFPAAAQKPIDANHLARAAQLEYEAMGKIATKL